MKTFALILNVLFSTSMLYSQSVENDAYTKFDALKNSNVNQLDCLDCLMKINRDTINGIYFYFEKSRYLDSIFLITNILYDAKSDIWEEAVMCSPYSATFFLDEKKYEPEIFIVTFNSERKANEALFSLNLNMNIVYDSRAEGLHYWDWQLYNKCIILFYSYPEETYNPTWFFKFCNIAKHHFLFNCDVKN